MKRTLLTSVLLLLAIISFSQSSEDKVIKTERVVGKNLLTQEDIVAKEYVFPGGIYQSYLDDTSGFLTVLFYKLGENKNSMLSKGELMLYDLKAKNTMWTTDMTIYLNRNIRQIGSRIIFRKGRRNCCLSIQDGTEQWRVNNDLYYIDKQKGISIGYKIRSMEYTNILEGVNMKNGKVVWKRELDRSRGWNSMFYLNDSTLLIVAAGLHTIDISSGLGWDYYAATVYKNYIDYIEVDVEDFKKEPSISTKELYWYNRFDDKIRGLVSNVLFDDVSLYFASGEKIARIDKSSGEEIWVNKLPVGTPSKSSIFIKGSLVFMVNHGYAFMRGGAVCFGAPFIAAFDRYSGERKMYSPISKKNDPILHFDVENDTLLVVFGSRLSKYSMLDGSLLAEQMVDITKYGKLRYFIDNRALIRSDSTSLVGLMASDSSKKYVYTAKRKTLVIDDELTITNQLDFDQLYITHIETPGYSIVMNKEQAMLIDADNRIIAELAIENNAYVLGSKLYYSKESSFFELDLAPLLESDSPLNASTLVE